MKKKGEDYSMKEIRVLEVMNYIDPDLIKKAGEYKSTTHRGRDRRFLRWGAMAASFALVVTAVLAVPSLREGFLGVISPSETVQTEGTEPPVTEVYSGSFSNADEAFKESGAVGGSSTLLSRKFIDETYNLAYLRPAYRGERELVSEEELDRWITEVYLKKEEEARASLPDIYQAIRELGIPKEELEEVNRSRQERGSDMVLPWAVIDALYMPPEEACLALINPLALYYNGHIYTWVDVRRIVDGEMQDSVSTESVECESIPGVVIHSYVDQTVRYCIDNMLISENVISRYFDQYEYGAEADEEYEMIMPEDRYVDESSDTGVFSGSSSVTHSETVRLRVENILQKPDLPNGCEVVSLAIVLNYYGYDISPMELYDGFMPKSPYDTGDPWESFVGDATDRGVGCYSPCLTFTGNSYLSSVSSELSARDVSGESFEYYKELVRSGVPVIIWGMKDMVPDTRVYYENTVNGNFVQWYKKSHCMVLIGFTEDTYIFCDPLRGIREYSAAAVERCFDINYRQACAVK